MFQLQFKYIASIAYFVPEALRKIKNERGVEGSDLELLLGPGWLFPAVERFEGK
jgi:hypothetical protein